MEQFWTDNKVIEFVNQFIDMNNFATRYKLNDNKLIDKFKNDGTIVSYKVQKIIRSKEYIKNIICKYYNIRDIPTGRVGSETKYKHLYIWFLRKYSGLTLLNISDEVGYKRCMSNKSIKTYTKKDGTKTISTQLNKILGDNASIIYAIKRINDRIDTEPIFREDIENIKKLIIKDEIQIS